MPRANRYFLPGHVWHITHRCHKKAFLLKFAKDRLAWMHWLFESRKRYGLDVLNYSVTSNHIHLLVHGNENREIIPRSLQLIAGRTAQEFNLRKKRNGAFWEDRYHATAVDTDEHLLRCMIYIDLNMVRADVVNHPAKWFHCGYNEIVDPPRRYRIVSRGLLAELLRTDMENLSEKYRGQVQASVETTPMERECAWTDSLAVGRSQFVEGIKSQLGMDAISRQVEPGSSQVEYTLRESLVFYNAHFGGEKGVLSLESRLFWDEYADI